MAHNTKKITRTERECEGDRVCDLDGKRTTILRSHILCLFFYVKCVFVVDVKFLRE